MAARLPRPLLSAGNAVLLPRAGVALGMALPAEQVVPAIDAQVLPLVIATMILFEITGPIVLRRPLEKPGEIDTLAARGR